MILATFVKYVQKTTSPIRLVFKAVTTLSKIVCLDSGTCFESNLNSATKCLGFCETRRHVSFETDSRVKEKRDVKQISERFKNFEMKILDMDKKYRNQGGTC